ncbi:MAG TPA: PHB depolymerase family esterase, partial [Dehalococcoidia bacterium]
MRAKTNSELSWVDRRSSWVMAAALLVALIVLSGCRKGDDGGAAATGSAPSGTSTPVAGGPSPPEATVPAGAAEPTATPVAPSETDASDPTVTQPPPAPTVAQQPPGPRTETATITIGGRQRTWLLYVPSTLPGSPAPLVIGLHGGFGSGEQFERTARFNEQAEDGGFLAAYPDGTGGFPTWNGGRCCGYAVRENVVDVGFIEAMVDAISAEYSVDSARVYATGHSNGAIMALRLACESDRFRAVGAVAGSLEVSQCNPPHPVSTLLIHGDADESHPLEGGQGPQSVSDVDFTSVADSMAVLAPAMGCSGGSQDNVSGAVTTT